MTRDSAARGPECEARAGGSAVDVRTTRHESYQVSLQFVVSERCVPWQAPEDVTILS